MAFNRLFVQDEELGKKDDDFRPGHPRHRSESYSQQPWLTAPRTRRRRLFMALALVVVVYLFIKNMPPPMTPSGDLVDIRDPTRTLKGFPVRQNWGKGEIQKVIEPVKSRIQGESATSTSEPLSHPTLSSQEVPPILRGSSKTADHYYDGPLKFFKLPESLYGITHTNGHREDNTNILFAAANAQSASKLIPLACEMVRYNRNYVHFAFFGRDPISMDEIREVNGANRDCDLYWHDARPDLSEISNDARMEYSVTSALFHLQNYIHPQAYIMDESAREERYFVKEIEAHSSRAGKSLIELPSDATERVMWITRLDHAALAAWDTVYIDLLVHVPPESSGSLIRLLKSIKEADYFGARVPHLTIELPPHVEPAAQRFLDNFIWPPLPKDGGKHVSKVTLRKRVSTAHLTPLEASIRTVESFYSARPHQSHVLLLSTQAELSPLYYQYAFYSALEYAYGYYSRNTYYQSHLAGLALDLPSVKLDGGSFTPPSPKGKEASQDGVKETSFLWQVPDTHAALYFGGKWQELHSYLSHRISLPPPDPQQKTVSTSFPAFAEPLLELMRARNWFMLFPNLPNGNAIATVHNDLATVPEEYTPDEPEPVAPAPKKIKEDTLYLEPAEPPIPLKSNREHGLLASSLTALLPAEADLPEFQTLPLMSWDAFDLSLEASIKQAQLYETKLRRSIGRCPASHVARVSAGSLSADDLFCAGSEPDPAPMNDTPPSKLGLPKIDDPAASPKSTDKASAGKVASGDAKSITSELESSGLAFDKRPPPEAPNPAKPGEMSGDASMQDIFAAEKAKARKQMGSDAADKLTPDKGPGGPGTHSEDSRVEDKASSSSDPLPGINKGGSSEARPKAPAVSKEDKDAMQREFKAHLERLNKSPDRMQAEVEEKLQDDIAKGKDKEENKILRTGL